MNVLVITGPINSQQAGVQDFAPATKVIDVQLGDGRVRSFHYAEAMQAFLAGRSLRKAVEARVGLVDRLGVLWFSAGHGAINEVLRVTDPAEVDVWLCLDGLYAGWKHQTQWATKLAKAAVARETVCVATASTTTPGQYADGLTSWKNVVVPLAVPRVQPPVPFDLFPQPAEMWAAGGFVLMGYPNISHGKQTPAMREGMMRVWSTGTTGIDTVDDRQPPGPGPDEPGSEPDGSSGWLIAGVVAVAAGLAAWAIGRKR